MIMMYMAFGLSALMIILGFVALLSQKIYIDPQSKKSVEFEIPLMGKMKSNYPSLIFVGLGVALAFYALDKLHPQPRITWEIDGKIINNGENFDWYDGQLSVFPKNIDAKLDRNGVFKIKVDIEEGMTFEDMIERVDYTHLRGNVQIFPKREYDAYLDQEESIIKSVTSHSRSYNPVQLEKMPEPNRP